MTRARPRTRNVRRILVRIALYLTVAALVLWLAQQVVEDRSYRWFSTFVRITIGVVAVALVVSVTTWDDPPERLTRTGYRVVETLGLTTTSTRAILYRSARNLALLTAVVWGLQLSETHSFRLFVDLETLFFLTFGIGVIALLVYSRFELGVRQASSLVCLVFLLVLGVTILVESPLGERYLRAVDRSPFRVGSLVLGTAVALARTETVLRRTAGIHSARTPVWSGGTDSRRAFASRNVGPRLKQVFFEHRYELALAAVIVVGFALRVYELAALPPYPDEYYHLVAAREVVRDGGSVSVPSYTRAFLFVTLPVSLSFEVLGPGLFSARFPITVGNLLAAVPLYLLLSRIDRPTALVAAFLYVTNPWNVAVARTVREYAVLPLFFLSVALLLVWVLERIPENAALGELHSRYGARRIGAFSAILTLPVFYAFVVDPKSTFKIVFGLYAVCFALFVGRLDLTDRLTGFVVGSSLVVGVPLAAFFLTEQAFLAVSPDYTSFALGLFTDDPSQQWYVDRSATAVAVCLVFGLVYALFSRNSVAVLCTLALCGYFYAFSFHFDRYTRPRYAFHLEVWFVILLAIGVVFLGRHVGFLVSASGRSASLVSAATVVLLLLAIVNPSQVLLAATLHDEYGGTYAPITDEHHIDAEAGLSVVPEYEAEADVILVHRPEHLQWYYPSVYEENEVIYYRCNDVDFEDDPVVDEVSDSNVLLVTSWRTNRENCVDEHPGLDDFESVGEYDHYLVYANFEPDDTAESDGASALAGD